MLASSRLKEPTFVLQQSITLSLSLSLSPIPSLSFDHSSEHPEALSHPNPTDSTDCGWYIILQRKNSQQRAPHRSSTVTL